jgi:preprotein translocase subunit SecE
MVDKLKLGIAALLLCGGIAGYYLLGESATIIRVAVVLAGGVLGALLALTTAPGKQFFAFAQESTVETRKVVWPSRKESFQTTGIVFLFVVVMALFLWVVDAGLLWAVKHLMGRSD